MGSGTFAAEGVRGEVNQVAYGRDVYRG